MDMKEAEAKFEKECALLKIRDLSAVTMPP